MSFSKDIMCVVTLILLSFVSMARSATSDIIPPKTAVNMGSEEGEVSAGNFSYYSVSIQKLGKESHDFYLRLKTLSGDVDLYVSGKGHKPTFAIGDHDFKSTTCGDESVYIPASYTKDKSPLVIGVYGHPSHAISSYSLEVYSWIPEDIFPVDDFPKIPYHESYEAHDKRYREARDAGGGRSSGGSDENSDAKDPSFVGFVSMMADFIESSEILSFLFDLIVHILFH